jgi:hypothetical protein
MINQIGLGLNMLHIDATCHPQDCRQQRDQSTNTWRPRISQSNRNFEPLRLLNWHPSYLSWFFSPVHGRPSVCAPATIWDKCHRVSVSGTSSVTLPSAWVQVFAGLTAAIECHSKGHHVILFEKSAFLNPLGEIISFASNFETDTHTGIAISNVDGSTTKLTADRVLAAEGARSPSRKIVLGYKSLAEILWLRAWFLSDAITANPRTSHLVVNGDTHCGWIGPDVHFLTASIKDSKDFSWVLTTRTKRISMSPGLFLERSPMC